MKSRLLIVGCVGTVMTALCCFTPLLPVVLGAIGLGALTGTLYNDTVLLPLLALFVILTGVALWRMKKSS